MSGHLGSITIGIYHVNEQMARIGYSYFSLHDLHLSAINFAANLHLSAIIA